MRLSSEGLSVCDPLIQSMVKISAHLHFRSIFLLWAISHFLKLLDMEWFLLNVKLLVESLLTGHHLRDGRRDHDVQIIVTIPPRNPFFWRDNLN